MAPATRTSWPFGAEVLAGIGGCYPAGLSGSEDQTFNRLLAEAGLAPCGAPIPTADMFYLYRWGVSDRHLSGIGGGSPANPHQGHYDAIGSRPIEAGEFHIRPHWRGNYAWPAARSAVLHDAVRRGHNPDGRNLPVVNRRLAVHPQRPTKLVQLLRLLRGWLGARG